MRRAPFRHDASGYDFYFRRCFILDVEKSACLWHDLVLVLLEDTEYVTKYHLLKSRLGASWRSAARRMKNASVRGSPQAPFDRAV